MVEFIPPHILNLEFVDEAIRANNFIIGGIPAELIKKETAVEVVINDSNLIKRIPETIKDIDFYEVDYDNAIDFIKKEYTEEK